MKSVRRKICLIANSGFTVVNFRSEFIKVLIERGCDVTVICPVECVLMGGRDLGAELVNIGAKHISIVISRSGINPVSEFFLLVAIFKVLRKEKPDVVLNYTIKPTIYGSIAAKLAGIKYIASNITGLGYIFTSGTFKSKLLSAVIKIQYKLSLRCNNFVFFQNPDDKALFDSLSLINSVKTKVINGSGVDTDMFRRVNLQPRPNSFIFIGRILRDKGVNEFLGAAKLLKSKYPDAIFTLLGPMDENPNSLSEKDLEPFISSGVVKYLPARPDVRAALEEHEVFVLPSYREGTPRSVLEAMSMSMPIVTTDVPGCRETVVSGSNGYLAEVRNIHSLASAMEKFIIDPSLVRKFGDSSREQACQRYDVKKVNDCIISELL